MTNVKHLFSSVFSKLVANPAGISTQINNRQPIVFCVFPWLRRSATYIQCVAPELQEVLNETIEVHVYNRVIVLRSG